MSIDGRAFVAGQAFLLSAKSYWTRVLYPAVRAEHQSGADLSESVLYQYYCWLERHLQRFKYSGRYGLQPYHAQDREHLEKSLQAAPAELQKGFEYPEYYTRVDIHQHPGGVWSDPIAGFVYERGARSTTPLAGQRHRDLHERLTAAALERSPAPGRVLDMGCGFGKSTRPFYEALPQAQIEAIDLSGPCLRLAARDAAQAGARGVRFRQMDCSRTDYPAGSFDLVTSTMLLHELPPAVVEKTLAEAHRLLQRGARMLHLDFLPGPDPFDALIHFGHARRNNEPFMEPLARMDLPALLERLGFRNIEIRPFEEGDGTLAPDYRYWRFPWALISAERW
ncbi:MAG TPA: class I SAM-dependent methyltransferase [Burkholderiales bacterium]|nr:class I SAM-dependent methyltransferase [Burkholderiales bacterium]